MYNPSSNTFSAPSSGVPPACLQNYLKIAYAAGGVERLQRARHRLAEQK